jgi:hypothetical protein
MSWPAEQLSAAEGRHVIKLLVTCKGSAWMDSPQLFIDSVFWISVTYWNEDIMQD